MEPVVYEESPLADYLREGGEQPEGEWEAVKSSSSRDQSPIPSSHSGPSPPPSPSPFAPTGRPLVKAKFRNKISNKLQLDLSQSSSLRSIRRNYSAVVAEHIDRADNAEFLERFRYIIVASQILSGHSIPGQPQIPVDPNIPAPNTEDESLLSTEGIFASVLGALAIAIVLSWVLGNGPARVTPKRFAFLVLIIVTSVLLGKVYMRRQWLRYRRQQSLAQITALISNSHEFDGATSAALSLIQEVELVSRGYRLSTPLPPISRIEDRSQSRKCVRIRKTLRGCLADALEKYVQVSTVVKGFAEQTDLEKYYDIYDIGDFDMSDAQRGFDADEFDDLDSLRTLKILAARFHVLRKMFLCSLLALDASGEGPDLLRWTTAVEALRDVNDMTKSAYDKLHGILSEDEGFNISSPPKDLLTPGRERWRSQLGKLNSLSSGIRGLQAKLQLLREGSDRALNDSNDISELGPNLMSQYESIGVDLKELMTAWEEGKAALAVGIDRNEKRLSSMSTLLSPTSSLSGLTSVEEGGTADALRALNGESPSRPGSKGTDESESPEVFEAVARPARPRSLLPREERLVKMREEREQKAHAKQQMDATRGMLRELETVINVRPRTRTSAPASGRIVSM